MKDKNKIKAAVLAISVVQMGTSAIASIIGSIAETFPQYSSSTIQFLMTFPSLFVIIFNLAAPSFAGRIGQGKTASAGCALFALSGVLSFLFHQNLIILYVFAAMMGTGIGLVVPFCNSVIIQCFDGNERNAMMGLQSSAANVGAMLMTFIGGFLAAIHWSCNYLVYLLAVPGMVLAAKYIPAKGTAEKKNHLSVLLKKRGIVLCGLVSVFVTLLFNTAPTNLSMLVNENGFGNASMAGIASTVLLASGTIGGLMFGKLSRHLKRYVMVFGFVSLMAGQLILAFAGNYAILLTGCVFAGLAMSTVMPQIMLDAGEYSDGNAAGSSALMMAFSNLGGFASPLITRLAAAVSGCNLVSFRFLTSACLAAVMAVILLIYLRSEKKDA